MHTTKKSRNAELFSQRLQQAMDAANISQADLARALNTAWSTVNRWFNGSVPRKRMIDDIAQTLGVASRWLETGDGRRYPEPPSHHHDPASGQYTLRDEAPPSPGYLAGRNAALASGIARVSEIGDRCEASLTETIADIHSLLNLAAATKNEALAADLIAKSKTRIDDFALIAAQIRQQANTPPR